MINPSYQPHPIAILAIDPGAESGFSFWLEGVYQTSGTVKTQSEREQVVHKSIEVAAAEHLHLIVVGETWSPGGWKSIAAIAGTGAAWGLWSSELERAGFPKSRIVRVKPNDWRRMTVGTQGKRAALKERAKAFASRLTNMIVQSPDQAEAIVIGYWATRAGEVAKKIPKRPVRAEAKHTKARKGKAA